MKDGKTFKAATLVLQAARKVVHRGRETAEPTPAEPKPEEPRRTDQCDVETCTEACFPVDLNGLQVLGLEQSPGAQNEADCRRACCTQGEECQVCFDYIYIY
jgi:hypothetical protein